MRRILGSVLLVAGIVVLVMAQESSESVADQTRHLLTGRYTDQTVRLTVGGAIATVLGLIFIGMPARGDSAS